MTSLIRSLAPIAFKASRINSIRPHTFIRTMAAAPGLLNVAHEIKLDHDNVRDLFERFKAATSKDEKGVIVNTLIREMAIHSDAEEVSVYNHFASWGLGDTAEHNREEHAEVKRLVYAADDASVDQPDYDKVISDAVSGFLTHAAEEEQDQLPKIEQHVSPEENDKLAREFLKARKMAPTRPHPLAPQTGGVVQKAAALQGKFHDKVIETLGNRKFVDVKYQHPESV